MPMANEFILVKRKEDNARAIKKVSKQSLAEAIRGYD